MKGTKGRGGKELWDVSFDRVRGYDLIYNVPSMILATIKGS